MICSHVDVKAAFPPDLLELSGGTGGTSKIIKAPNNLQHGRQRHPARISSEAGVRTITVMDIRLQRPVDADTVRRWEDLGIASGAHLGDGSVCLHGRREVRNTYKTAEDLVTRLHRD